MIIQQCLNELGLDPNSSHTPEAVKSAWRKKCNENHPDKEGGDKDKFLAVMHAYKLLTDPSYRRESEDNKAKNRKNDLTIRMQVPISFEDMFFGRSVKISYNRIEKDSAGAAVIKEEQDIVTLNLMCPAGVNGSESFIPGKGLKCGDEYGDVIVQFVTQNHPRYSLDGPNVVAQERIELDVCLKGGDIEVQTMYGLKTARVPPGTRPGDRINIKNCGVRQEGTHIVIVDVIYPTKEDLKQKAAWQQLDIDWAKQDVQDEAERQMHEAFARLGGFRVRGFTV